MSDKEKPVENETEASAEDAAGKKEPFLEYKGRTFETAGEATAFMDALALSQGSIAQKFGDLQKEAEPLRKYNLKNADLDEVGMIKKVDALREEGDNASADRLLLEFVQQVKSDGNVRREEDRLWSDYVKARPEIFKALDEDMSRDHVFNNYRDKLNEVDNPFSLFDSVLKPKASRLTPQSSDDDPAATLGGGNQLGSSDSSKEESGDKGSKELGPMDKVMEELGVKKS